MEITKEWLTEKEACSLGLQSFLGQAETDLYKLIDKLTKENKESWANWLITRAMNRQQQLKYAITCAELALPIFEARYPQDNRPRAAIEAAKKVFEDDSGENRAYAAKAAASAADAAAAAKAAWESISAGTYSARATRAVAAAAIRGARAAKAAASAAISGVSSDATNAAANAAADIGWEPILEAGTSIMRRSI